MPVQRTNVFQQYLTTFGATFISLATQMISSILIARALGSIGRGEFTAVALWPGLLPALGGLGLIDALWYFSAKEKEQAGLHLGNVLIFTIVQSAVLVGLAYLLMPSLLRQQSEEVIVLARFYVTNVPLSLYGFHLISVLRAHMHNHLTNVAQILQNIAQVAGILIMWATNTLTLHNVIVFLYIHLVVMCIALTIVFVRAKLGVRLSFDWRALKPLLAYGLAGYFGTLFVQANNRLDQTIMAATFPVEQLGFYAVAAGVAAISGVLANAFWTMAYTDITRQADDAARKERFITLFQVYWLISFVFKAAFALSVPILIPLLYTEAFVPSIVPALILVGASIFYDGRLVLGVGAKALGTPSLASRAEFVAFLPTVILLPLLLPAFGIMGAAWVSVISYVVAFLAILVELQRVHGLSWRRLLSLSDGFAFIRRVVALRLGK
jgi:O-antigen/teichoic acid export membrane protein